MPLTEENPANYIIKTMNPMPLTEENPAKLFV
jgi:hypothetical protein